MCGLSGLYDANAPTAVRTRILERMTATIAHRGPDGAGFWHDPNGALSLGHRRLAIVELSELGAQPMASADGRLILTFNGEIYNFAVLRKALEAKGTVFRGESDTEILLELMAKCGAEQALEACVGMFAFALWDRQARVLTLGRDRMGEKPLYYGYLGGGPGRGPFAFASELRALRAHPDFAAALSAQAVSEYARVGYVPEPQSIFEGIAKLPAGCFLQISEPELSSGALPKPRPYWRLTDAIECGTTSRHDQTISDEAWIDRVETALKEAVRLQMHADVPLGAFLSGGIDSTTIVALMQEQSARPVRTFTIGFERAGFDEAPFARAIAARLGTEHHELYARAEDAMAVAQEMPGLYDEPFADSSQIPTCLVSRLARKHVTVSLSGDAGDELFGGYNRYLLGPRLAHALARIPTRGRSALAGALLAVSPHLLERGFAAVSGALPGRWRFGGAGDRLHKLARALSAKDADELYHSLTTTWPNPALVNRERFADDQTPALPKDLPVAERMMALDALGYLPGDILTKVDRAAMSCSLESRVPFLDHRVVELAWQTPLRLKIRDGQGKWVLRRVLERRIPAAMMDRPKTGFSIPLDDWLRGPLRDWVESAISDQALRRDGVFDAKSIRGLWSEHLSGRWNRQNEIWSALMLTEWLSRNNSV